MVRHGAVHQTLQSTAVPQGKLPVDLQKASGQAATVTSLRLTLFAMFAPRAWYAQRPIITATRCLRQRPMTAQCTSFTAWCTRCCFGLTCALDRRVVAALSACWTASMLRLSGIARWRCTSPGAEQEAVSGWKVS